MSLYGALSEGTSTDWETRQPAGIRHGRGSRSLRLSTSRSRFRDGNAFWNGPG